MAPAFPSGLRLGSPSPAHKPQRPPPAMTAMTRPPAMTAMTMVVGPQRQHHRRQHHQQHRQHRQHHLSHRHLTSLLLSRQCSRHACLRARPQVQAYHCASMRLVSVPSFSLERSTLHTPCYTMAHHIAPPHCTATLHRHTAPHRTAPVAACDCNCRLHQYRDVRLLIQLPRVRVHAREHLGTLLLDAVRQHEHR